MNKRVFEPSPSERKEKQLQEKGNLMSGLQREQSGFAARINRSFSVWPCFLLRSGPETVQFIVTFKDKISVEEFVWRMERAFEC
jgi:hypothetical protein